MASQTDTETAVKSRRNKLRQARVSISTDYPSVMLTPPNPEEVVKEERRLSVGSLNSDQSDMDDTHLVPPEPKEPEEIVRELIHQRRPSSMSLLSDIIKNIYTEKKIKEDGIPQQIIDRLFLGSIGAAKNINWLKKHGITHILCVAGGIGECFPNHFIYKVIEIDDSPSVDIQSYFNASFDFIENALNSNENTGKVLVHCFAGMSRSVTVVSAYLMQQLKICAIPALKMVKSKREIANPNAGFLVQLIKYQKILGLIPIKNTHTNGQHMIHSDDLPSDSDDDTENEEKSHQPQLKTRINNIFLKPQKPQKMPYLSPRSAARVNKWESGRRPSLFTALAKLKALKNRKQSMDSNVSDDDDDVNHLAIDHRMTAMIGSKSNSEDTNDGNETPISILAGDIGMHSPPLCDNKLGLLKEVSNETDATINSDQQNQIENAASITPLDSHINHSSVGFPDTQIDTQMD